MKRALADCDVLPEDLYFENILTRLPAKDLAICSCVCKLWYKTIKKDSRFASSHLIQNACQLNLVFNLLNVFYWDEYLSRNYSFNLEKEYHGYGKFTEGFGFDHNHRHEVVGYCNGLTCLKAVVDYEEEEAREGVIYIINQTMGESLTLCYVTPSFAGGYYDRCNYLCHGFGFDILSQKYKVVLVFATPYSLEKGKFFITNSKEADHQEIVCMVLTLGGTGLWRKMATSISQVTKPGSTPFPNPMLTKASIVTDRQATLCAGDLFWRITLSSATSKNDKIEMLLSFDIHNEKMQLIRFPTECSLTPPMLRLNEHRDLVVDHHLLEFKGCPCVARSEMIVCHRYNDRSRGGACSCSVKVHLYILKDKGNQVWSKGEIFDIQIEEEGLRRFCRYLGTTTTKRPPFIRMLSFSNQPLLYWFDGECVVFYNLQKKHLKLKVVKCCGNWISDIFETKMKGRQRQELRPYLCDYQLHPQVENVLSLETFLPEGETRTFFSLNDFEPSMRKGNRLAGWTSSARKSAKGNYFRVA